MYGVDTRIELEEKGRYSVGISGNWSINNTPNGGYVMALLTRAMEMDCDLSARGAIVTANYIDRCGQGPGQILVETLGESGGFLRMQARLILGGRERIRAMATFVKPSACSDDALTCYAEGPESVSSWESCVRVPCLPGYSLYGSVDLRLDPESAGWMENRFSDRAVMKGWICFSQERPVDFGALALFADAFPPAVFASRGMVTWVPTIEYSVNIRKLPECSRIKGIFSTRFISGGLVEEDGELWDDNDTLLAVSRQIAKYTPLK